MINHRDRSSSRPPLVQALHTAVRGRARFRVQGLRGSHALKHYLELHLLPIASIRTVSASVVTGNVLVLFDPGVADPANPLVIGWRWIAALIERLLRERPPDRPLAMGWPAAQVKGSTHEATLHAIASPRTIFTASARSTALMADPPNRPVARSRPSVRSGYPEGLTTPLPTAALQGRLHSPATDSWHVQDAKTVLATFQTSVESGLSSQEAQLNLQLYGPNVLPTATPRSRWAMFLDQFKSVPVALLTAAAGISVLTGGLADAAVIMGVVLINGVIGYTTESQSDRIIRSLKQRASPTAWVIRDRVLCQMDAQTVVPGDILMLRPGAYVAADARVIEAQHLRVDESALTGESLPVSKTPVCLEDCHVPLGDRSNMVYMGTLVTGGQGLAVVVATASLTEMGKIQTMVGQAATPETPMERQLDRAGSQLVLLSSTVCGAVFGLGLLRGYGVLDMLKTSIALAVAAVPEGLPAVATTTLALGIRNMRKQKVLIRRLDAVETLGSLQALCLDKTGTLTTNKMSVVEVHTDNTHIDVSAWPDLSTTQSSPEASDPRLTRDPLGKLLQVVVLCNESDCRKTGKEWVFRGSSTENALLEMAIQAGVDVEHLRRDYPLLHTQHRSEEHNFMQTLHDNRGEAHFIAVKGNPIEVLSLCNWQLEAGKVTPLTPAKRQMIEADNDRMAGNGLRILGVAYGHTSVLDVETHDNLVWLGLVGMADPIRNGVKDVMGVFHRAGIETVMITGDQSPTAYAIGKALDLSQGAQLEILDSTDLANLDPAAVSALCDRVHVFSRISPANKLQVVQALQRSGKVVAMTGDGINDAPALKAAEVGIAMGHTGTDVAREVADVVLEDDNLQTMAIAVSQGRTIYNNIRKSVHFLLSTNLSEIMVMLAGISLGLGQPLNAMQLLWLNLVTDIFPGLALALEPPEPDVLMQPPRNPAEPIIQPSDFRRIAVESAVLSTSALAAYSYAIRRYGMSPRSSTIGFMSLTLAQLLHAVSCRSKARCLWRSEPLPPNRYLAIALSGSILLQLLSVMVPGLRQLLQIAPLSLGDVAVIGSSALVPLVVNEASKGK